MTINMDIVNSAKTILCYGDSNTWGNIPYSDDRYPRNIRWPSVLQKLLGEGYEVISEGLCGRTFVAEDKAKPHRTGITHLHAILESADPIDLVIIMLGTNDVKSTYNLSVKEIQSHLEQTITFIRSEKLDLEKIPNILVICPPPVISELQGGRELDSRMVRGIELFKSLPILFKQISQQTACGYINAGEYISSSSIDGYHFSAEGHIKLAGVIKQWVLDNNIGNS